MPNTFTLVPVNGGRYQINSSVPAPKMLFSGKTPELAAKYIAALNHLYDHSPTFRTLISDHAAHGGGIKLFDIQGNYTYTRYDPGPGRKESYSDSGSVGGFVDWVGRTKGNGHYVNDPSRDYDMSITMNQVKWSYLLDANASDLSLRKFAAALAHEMRHPFAGAHIWQHNPDRKPANLNDIRNDPTTQFELQIMRDLGSVIRLKDGRTAVTSLPPGGNPGQYLVVSEAEYQDLMNQNELVRYRSSERANTSVFGVYVSAPHNESSIPWVRLSVDRAQFGQELGSTIGSSLGNYFANGDIAKGIIYSSVLGEIGERLGQALATGNWSAALERNVAGASADAIRASGLAQFGADVWDRMQSAAVGTVSSLLAMELGEALGIQGFGSELFNVAGSTVINKAFSNVLNGGANSIWNGFKIGEIFDSATPGVNGGPAGAAGAGTLVVNAIGSFLGSKLGSLVVSPTTQAGALLSSIGSAVGSWAVTTSAISLTVGTSTTTLGLGIAASIGLTGNAAWLLGNLILPGVGAFVGFVLGSLIGNLFGRKKPRIPSASAETVLQIPEARYELGAVVSANGGNRDLAKSMAVTSRNTLNALISHVIEGGQTGQVANLDGSTTTQRYGHTGNQIYVKINGVQHNSDSADKAVEYGALSALRSTNIIGGDIFAKRAMHSSQATDLANYAGDIQVAADYRFYAENREMVNRLIYGAYGTLTQAEQDFYAYGYHKAVADTITTRGFDALTEEQRGNYYYHEGTYKKVIQALDDQSLANPWIISLQRATEIGLDKWSVSDFHGGLRGFLNSFDLTDRGLGFENIDFTWEGGPVRVRANGGSNAEGLFSIMPSAQNNGRDVVIDSGIWSVGYNPTHENGLTAGNDYIWYGWEYGGGRTINDYHGGDDIFVGSQGNDSISGGVGWDWLDGQGGTDHVWGGEHNDVLLGGAGDSDHLWGEAGDDYLHGGDGAYDRLWGGAGNDTLADSQGYDDAHWGEDGDDVFLVQNASGPEWNWYDGGNGSDTVSFERFYRNPDPNQYDWMSWPWAGRWQAGHFDGIAFRLDTKFDYGWTPVYGGGMYSVENLTGTRFNDYLWGDAGANTLKGGDGNDFLDGHNGDDILEGGAGADFMFGAGNWNTLSYAGSSAAVYVDITTHVAFGGDAEGDTFEAMQHLRGSRFSDELKGDAGYNQLEGGGGDDVLAATYGGDIYDGGDGFDTVDFSAATDAGVGMWLGSNVDTDKTPGHGWSGMGVGSYRGVEAVLGTIHGDDLRAGAGDHVLQGNGGNDYLEGGLGSDTYVYGLGDGFDSIADSNEGANAISLKTEGLNWRNIAVYGAGGNGSLVVHLWPTGEQLAVGGNFSYAADGNHNHVIKTLDIGGGSSVDISAIDWSPDGAVDNASTVIYGGQNKADIIFAYAGDDTIYAAGGYSAYENRGNVIYAGDGNDYISTSSGDDQFIFERGNGSDTINDTGGIDTVIMGPSVSADDVIFEIKVKSSDSFGGQAADLYIGIRDANNPGLSASQVADRIQIVDGGTQFINIDYGDSRFNSIEHVRVAGQEIDLSKAGINYTVSYYRTAGTGSGRGGGGHIPPLAIDLDGDGIELRSVHGSHISTVSTDGSLWRVGWLGQDDGFLALDRNGDGTIDRLNEISFTQDLEGAKSDLEGLAAYDSNKDGKLDSGDARWSEFKIWQDKNQDGIGLTKELTSLQQAGILSISLKGQATGFTKDEGIDNTILATTVIEWADPKRTGLGYDVALATYQVRTDGGDKELADRNAKAKGKAGGDALEASLFGIQAFSQQEAEAIKAKGKKPVLEEGMLGRVETFLGGTDLKKVDGLQIVGGVDDLHGKNRKDADDAEKGKMDKFADDGWTLEGSKVPGKRDTRGDDKIVKTPDLTADQLVNIEKSRKKVRDHEDGVEAATAALNSSDRDSMNDTVIGTAEDRHSSARGKAEKLLKIAQREAAVAGNIEAAAEEMPLKGRPSAELADAPAEQSGSGQAAVPTSLAEEPVGSDPKARATSESTQSAVSEQQEGSPEEIVYEGRIAMTNARLVQALAGFGDKAPMMMTGKDAANDYDDFGRSHWLTVGHQASVQRLASVG